MKDNPLIVAIDTDDFDHAQRLVTDLKDHVGLVKLGMEFFFANGLEGVRKISDIDVPIFLDLKIHDTPTTTFKAILTLSDLDIAMLTVSVHSGPISMHSARQAVNLGWGTENPPKLLGVSVLTSVADDELDLVFNEHANQHEWFGLDGMICSGNQVYEFKSENPDALAICPGIRPKGADLNDQENWCEPQQAIDNGADYIVVGRPITAADDPVKAVSGLFKV